MPIHCFKFSFSLKNIKEDKTISISPPPFSIGNNITLDITPDKCRFITLLKPANMPENTNNINIMYSKRLFFCLTFSINKGSLRLFGIIKNIAT